MGYVIELSGYILRQFLHPNHLSMDGKSEIAQQIIGAKSLTLQNIRSIVQRHAKAAATAKKIKETPVEHADDAVELAKENASVALETAVAVSKQNFRERVTNLAIEAGARPFKCQIPLIQIQSNSNITPKSPVTFKIAAVIDYDQKFPREILTELLGNALVDIWSIKTEILNMINASDSGSCLTTSEINAERAAIDELMEEMRNLSDVAGVRSKGDGS